MKFNVAWSNIARENLVLKATIISLTLLLLGSSFSLLFMANREPLIIDRGCYSESVEPGSTKRTKSEIKAFLKVALSKRFDTDVKETSSMLSIAESEYRRKEQKNLQNKSIRQNVLVHSVHIDKERGITVSADRLVAVGNIRSAFRFPLAVKISNTDRSITNPYGLVLTRVSPIKKKTTKGQE